MPSIADPCIPHAYPPLFGWRRVRVVLVAAFIISLIKLPGWQASYALLIARLLLIGGLALLAFGLFERWPQRLPRWIARWALQVIAVAFAVVFGTALAYTLTTTGLDPPWWRDNDRLGGFLSIAILGLLTSPWIAVSALLRQIKDEARNQALAFELERSEYERNALDARLRLLQAQIEPHFLFNTLANVRELVDSGSAQASSVLGSLIAYLRAAVPRLHETATTFGQELDLVRAYLEVMHMRMPDRLHYLLHADDMSLDLFCPPMNLLSLVENAVRHGIDQSEDGGRIEVRVRVHEGRCRAEVVDTGVGLAQSSGGLGTGLANLRERLQLAFGDEGQFRLTALQPHGVCAEVEFPARRRAA
jgi:sensor histidine kinase YesM